MTECSSFCTIDPFQCLSLLSGLRCHLWECCIWRALVTALPLLMEKMKPFCDYLHSGMDFRGQPDASNPSIYFKSHAFYSVGGKSRYKRKKEFISWGKWCVMIAAFALQQPENKPPFLTHCVIILCGRQSSCRCNTYCSVKLPSATCKNNHMLVVRL